ncbi:hypothetical protein K1W69_22850 [Hoeflea sp. WL0058]|uniref:Uncharacterized protein n=1 Tax=Flavimaribacter sediminis TaxID=2865987 RepID=A0AAE2ZNY4_9HYPH|nr:hypothetical protein [Flavimaribacter sediminis]MBW8640053.1 hypothetical protein [Flavimaribacter sediminis]
MSDTDVSVLDVRNLKDVFQAPQRATRDVISKRLFSKLDAPFCASPRKVDFSSHPLGDVLSAGCFPRMSLFPCAPRGRSNSTGKFELTFRKIGAVGFMSRHRREFMIAAASTSSSRIQH